jgi:hypothetical protein
MKVFLFSLMKIMISLNIFCILKYVFFLLDKVSSSSNTLDSSCVDWAKQAAHRCLVYLGDLSRYFLDLHPHWDSGLPARYYLQVSVHDIYQRNIVNMKVFADCFLNKRRNGETSLHCFKLSERRTAQTEPCTCYHHHSMVSLFCLSP